MTLYDPHSFLPDLAGVQDVRLLRELVETRLLFERAKAEPRQMKSIFRFYGSKKRIAEQIIALFPPHKVYVEGCLGSGAVFFAKSPSHAEVLSDINGEIVHFFRMLRERPDDLIRACALTPYAEEELIAGYRQVERPIDDIERARRFYVRLELGWNSGGRLSGGFRRDTRGTRHVTAAIEYIDVMHLYQAAARLQHAQIDRADVMDQLIRYNDPDTLLYLDLPYVQSARGSEKKMYADEMSDATHRQIADLCHWSRSKIIISGYQSPLYEELYADWQCVTIEAYDLNKQPQSEYLWISPNAVKPPTLTQTSFLQDA
jgi:DNA adenine methylase